MRVIAGKWGGRCLIAPTGKDTRPTTDRVKESIMSSIESRFGFTNRIVLDAFAGSGGLGIEALSRGAKYVCFADKSNEACMCIRKNLTNLDASKSCYKLIEHDIFSARISESVRFDLVLLDPPYATSIDKVIDFINSLEQNNNLNSEALIYYEHSKINAELLAPLQAIGLRRSVSKKMGDIYFDLFMRG